MKHLVRALVILSLLAGTAGLAMAQRGRHPHPPPPEAFEACEGMEQGDRCEFEGPDGTIEGSCETPVGDDLVCVPDRPPPRR